MKTYLTVTAALLTGAAIGGFAVQGLRAQAGPPVYYVSEIDEITDAEGFKAVSQRSQSTAGDRVSGMGGRYVLRTNNLTNLQGTPPKRLIIIGFDSMDKAKAFAASDSQKQIDAIADKTTKNRRFLAEGL